MATTDVLPPERGPDVQEKVTLRVDRIVKKENVMKAIDYVGGTFIWLMSALASLFVVFYVYSVEIGQPPDFHIVMGNQPIPPESYPILLLAGWMLVQAVNSKLGIGIYHETNLWARLCYWEDVLEIILVVLFLVYASYNMLTTGTSTTFLFVQVALIVGAVVSLMLTINHREQREPASIRLSRGTDTTVSGGMTRTTDSNLEIPVTLVFTHMRLPGGKAVEIPETINLTPLAITKT